MPASEHSATSIDPVPVRLRGHHFLCVLTYRGFGYSPAFVANMSAVVEAIGQGRKVALTTGLDDICAGLTAECRLACDHDCGRAETLALDLLAIEAVRALQPGIDQPDFVLDADAVARLRRAFAEGSIRKACARCPWSDFCDEIAAEGFSGVRLFSPDRRTGPGPAAAISAPRSSAE